MTDEATPQEATPAPISPQNVVSTPEPAPAPDSSILSGKLNALLSEPEPQPVSDIDRLREQIERLNIAQQPAPQQPKSNPIESELKELREQQSQLRDELQGRIEQQGMAEASKELSSWVTSNKDHFPLINDAGYQGVVMQKILNTKQQTGRVIDAAQAGREVEQELADLIDRCAPSRGYVKRDEQTAASEEAQISTTTDGMNLQVPPDWDNMSDDEQIAYLVRQVEG